MDEALLSQIHSSIARSGTAFHQAATVPLLNHSSLPHPAMGGGCPSSFPASYTPQLTSVAVASLQTSMEQLTMRVAKLESLFYVFETQSQRAAHVAAATPYADIRSILSETMEPVRTQIRQHESMLLDIVQSLNHAAAWGYSANIAGDAMFHQDRHAQQQQQFVGTATVAERVAPHLSTPPGGAAGGRGAGNNNARGSVSSPGGGVIVSPLTKAENSGITTSVAEQQGYHPEAQMQRKIDRLRLLANELRSDGGTLEAPQRTKPSRNRQHQQETPAASKQNHHAYSNTSSSTAPPDLSPAATTALTSTTSRSSSGIATTTTTSQSTGDALFASNRIVVSHQQQSSSDQSTTGTGVLQSVKRIIRHPDATKTRMMAHSSSGFDEGAEEDEEGDSTSQSNFVAGGGGAHVDESRILSTPSRVRFFGDDDPLQGVTSGGRVAVTSYPYTSDTDTTTTSVSVLAPGGGHYRHGVQNLMTPESTRYYGSGGGGAAGGGGGDTSSYSDAYQELIHQMKL